MKQHPIELAVLLLSAVLVGACDRLTETGRPTTVAESKQVMSGSTRQASFGPTFTGDSQLIEALGSLQSPGLGYFMANQVGGGIDQSLDLVYVEMPDGQFNRYFALEYKPDGTIQVVDDFVAPNEPEITRVRRQQSGALQYAQSNGNVVVPKRDP